MGMRLPPDLERDILARAETVGKAQLRPTKRHKYGAVATVVDGVKFASKKEAKRYAELKIMEQAGDISDLELQPRYPLTVDGVKVGEYRADFRYRRDGVTVVEDVKGVRTAIYRMKKKMVEAIYGITIVEV
jgi:hypothetical protein